MTIIDLIRKLHKEGTVVLDCEVFTTTDIIGIEDAIWRWNVAPFVMRNVLEDIAPGSVELGEKPDYLVCHNAEEYEDHTGVELPKAKYPRLLVCVNRETMVDFSKQWKGHYWKDIPPLELQWSQVSFYDALPRISKEGIFVGYEATFPGEHRGSYYVLRDRYGNICAWGGDLAKDDIPDGMTVEDAGKFI